MNSVATGFKSGFFVAFIFFSDGNMKVDIKKLVIEVLHNSQNAVVDKNGITLKIKELMSDNDDYDPWHVCRGHDLVHILTFLIKHNFGNRRAKNITYEIVDGLLRIAYGYAEFSRTKLFVLMKIWEESNPKYRLLRSSAI